MNNSLFTHRADALIRFFLYILIFWLPYSSAVIESCVVLCLILWFFKRCILLKGQTELPDTLKKRLLWLLKGFKPESTFLNKPIAFFLLACLLSVTNSAFFGQSLHNFLTKTLEWFIIYFLVVEVFKSEKHVTIALAIFVFTAFSTSIDSLIQFYITHKDIFLGHVIGPGDRATAGFKTSNGLGGYLTIFIPGLFTWILFAKQKLRYRLGNCLVLSFAIWSLAVTFSRGAWIGVFLGGMFLFIFILSSKKKLKFYFSFGFFLLTVFLCVAFLLVLANSSSSGQVLLDKSGSIEWRLEVWHVCMEMIKDKLFFGHGINTFMRIFQAYRENFFMGPTYAHNCYIQLTAETGIIGLFCFLWIVVKMFHQSLGKIILNFAQDRNNLGVLTFGLLSGIFAYLVHSFFDTHFYSLQLSVYLWLMVGMMMALCKILDTQTALNKVISLE